MTYASIRIRTRTLAVAVMISAATVSGLATAQAVSPAESLLPSAPVAGACQSYWPSPYQVCGAIRDLYISLGGPNSALSFPTANEVAHPDGSKSQTFVNGTIIWTPTTGAHVS